MLNLYAFLVFRPKVYLNVVVLLLLLNTIGGCDYKFGNKTASDTTQGERLLIAVMPKGSKNPFWRRVHAGALKASEELMVDIIWQDPIQQNNIDLQRQLVNNFIKRDIDALVLAPVCQTGLIGPVKQAVKKLPVVVIDSDLKEQCYTSFVGTDNFEFGKQCARQMAESLGGKGTIIMLRFDKNQGSTTLREEGFLAGMKAFAPQVKILEKEKFGGVTVHLNQAAAVEILQQYPHVNGIFASNGQAAEGMLQALRKDGRAGKVTFIGVDATEVLLDALQAGEINYLGVQDPYMMGYLGVKKAVDAALGKSTPTRVTTKVVMLSKHNLTQPAIQALVDENKDIAML